MLAHPAPFNPRPPKSNTVGTRESCKTTPATRHSACRGEPKTDCFPSKPATNIWVRREKKAARRGKRHETGEAKTALRGRRLPNGC